MTGPDEPDGDHDAQQARVLARPRRRLQVEDPPVRRLTPSP